MRTTKEQRKQNRTKGKTAGRRPYPVIMALFMMLLTLTSCTTAANSTVSQEGSGDATQETRVDTGFVVTIPGDYDSADTPVVVSKNSEENTITFLNLDIGRRYTLEVDGTTKFTDKYGETISLQQIVPGDIVDVTFLKEKKHLTSLQVSSKAFTFADTERYEVNEVRNEITIGGEIYKLSKDALYFSGERTIEKMDINPSDILSFQGIDNTIYSVVVEKGHGYLRLANDEHFIGGWIELGESEIHKISEGMLLTVPEGSYQVTISHNGSGGVKNVIINRNEESLLDIGDLEVAKPQSGMVLFSITPSNAKLYIDGEEADFSKPVTLEYGIHQLIVKAEGYQSITQYLRVGQASAGIDIVLDKVDADGSSVSGNDSASSGTIDTTTDYYKVYIDAPEKVEVYLDGSYIGISPCSFKKTSGRHVITLRRNGYENRSYTVEVDSEDKDTTYSFADLVPSTASSETGAGTGTMNSIVSDMLGGLLGTGN